MTDEVFKPLNSNVLVKMNEKEMIGSIHLPANLNHGIVTGEVIDIGDSVLDVYGNGIPVNVQVGDTVYYRRLASMEVIPNSGKYLVAYKDLIGKVPS